MYEVDYENDYSGRWRSFFRNGETRFDEEEIATILNKQAQQIEDLQAENKRLLEAIGNAYESFSHIHGLQDGLQILANATNKKEGE